MQSWPSQNDIVGRGDVDYQEIYLYVRFLSLVPKSQWEADHSRGVPLLPPKAQNGMYERDDPSSWVLELFQTIPRDDIH